jgi:hypothetical protein
MEVLESEGQWDLVILHPDCTALATSGNGTYGDYKPKHHKRVEAIRWTRELVRLARSRSRRLCVENPRSVIFTYLHYESFQWAHPWMFGHPERKETGLALWNLPRLAPTHDVYDVMKTLPKGTANRIHRMGAHYTRKQERSVTYQGIADAMASQWGDL